MDGAMCPPCAHRKSTCPQLTAALGNSNQFHSLLSASLHGSLYWRDENGHVSVGETVKHREQRLAWLTLLLLLSPSRLHVVHRLSDADLPGAPTGKNAPKLSSASLGLRHPNLETPYKHQLCDNHTGFSESWAPVVKEGPANKRVVLVPSSSTVELPSDRGRWTPSKL